MQTTHPLHQPSELTVQTTRRLIHEPAFCHRHRATDKQFTRRRRLTFMNVVALLLPKTVRSIPLHWHDFFAALTPDSPTVTAASWCEARLKLRHTAFLELNPCAILEVVYGGRSDFAVRQWKGHRLLGYDSVLVQRETPVGQET